MKETKLGEFEEVILLLVGMVYLVKKMLMPLKSLRNLKIRQQEQSLLVLCIPL